MRGLITGLAAAALTVAAAATPAAARPADAGTAERYIVVLEDGAAAPGSVAAEHARAGAAVEHVYGHALRGYSARMSPAAAARVASDPRVAYVERDAEVSIAHHRAGHGSGGTTPPPPSQTLPTGVNRVDADANALAAIDGVDTRVDVDVAIIDTGMDEDHPDLNIAGGWNCVSLFNSPCADGLYEDGHGHGTHVAGTVGALDNGYGVVGVAPGARLWAVAVLDDNGSGYWSWIIAGIDKVAANADVIEIANMSLGGTGYLQSARDAIAGAVAEGVVFTVAAGNSAKDVYGADGQLGTSDDFVPAAFPEVAAISALADSDGAPGGAGSGTVYGADDSFASFSNFSAHVAAGNPVTSPGRAVDLILPGVGIYSTDRYGGYRSMSGTSMASPHAAGLAALHVAQNGRAFDAAGVAAVRQALIDGGKTQSSAEGLAVANDPDGYPEHLGWAGPSSAPADPDNTAPVAVDDAVATDEDVALVADAPGVLGNDSDADGDPITAVKLTNPSHGSVTLNADGSFTYTPAADFNGTDSFTYAARDGAVTGNAATVTVTVNPVADAPVGVADSAATGRDTPVTIDVLANDSDPDGDALSVTGLTQPANGAAVVNSDGTVTYTPATGFGGTDSFTYAPSDGTLTGDPVTVTVDVRDTATTATVTGIAYSGQGGKDNNLHLLFDVTVRDDLGAPVAGASVSVLLVSDTGVVGSATGTTDASGVAAFRASKAPAGCYTTSVTDVTASGLTWDGTTPSNEYCK